MISFKEYILEDGELTTYAKICGEDGKKCGDKDEKKDENDSDD